MSKDQESQKVADKIKEIDHELEERADLVNFQAASAFNVQKDGLETTGNLSEPYKGVSYTFNDREITFQNTDQKFKESDAKIQNLLNEASQAASSSQDQAAVQSTDNGNKGNESEQVNSELTSLKKDVENSQSQTKELQAKLDETNHAKELSQKEYDTVHQTKEQLMQDLTPQQVNVVTSTPAVEPNQEAQLTGEV